MLRHALGLFVAISTLAACGGTEETCTAEVNCVIAANGDAKCKEGFEWANPSDPDDMSCKEIQGGGEPLAPVCGDGYCTGSETEATCAQDCQTGPECGDGTCENGESTSSCPADCGSPVVCGDGTCSAGETQASCPGDCTPVAVCGDGTCQSPDENEANCVADCGPQAECGDGTCELGETATSCAADCGGPFCGDGTCDDPSENETNCAADCGTVATCAGVTCSGHGSCVEGDVLSCMCDEGYEAAGLSCVPTQLPVPEFGDGDPTLTLIADSTDGLSTPRDLEFHPDRPTELWVANRATDSMTILFDAGTAQQSTITRKDAYGNHFMEEVSSFAFGVNDTFGTCQESRNTYDGQGAPNDFMGPALWPADLDIFAAVNQYGTNLLGSHLDMLHQSPNCMGIAHDSGNAYWVFDGMNGHVVYYDFASDHGPGGEDHSDGIVRRYPDVTVTRVADVPGHMQVHKATGWLYVADTGAGRVFRMDTNSVESGTTLPLTNEYLAEFRSFSGATVEPLVSNLGEPSGLLLHNNRMFISDHATGEILAYQLDGTFLGSMQTGMDTMGLAVGPEGKLWFVDGSLDRLYRVDP